MIAPKDLYCFNPKTGKRDGNYCVWEGGGKCLKCEAADRIAELEQQLSEPPQVSDEQVEAFMKATTGIGPRQLTYFEWLRRGISAAIKGGSDD